MAVTLSEELVDSVYRTVLEPAAWGDVMLLMKRNFPSAAQTFYFLHLEPHRVQPVSLAGVEPSWVRSFNDLYFAPDNPWIRLTQRLHRPGVVRTNERLDRFLGDQGVLYRSAYYNDWMRPQGFKYTIGNTLLAERGMVANITLLRSPDMPTFDSAEVRAFGALSRHMTRALHLALEIERPESCPASIAALDAMPRAIALVDAQRRLLHANAAMELLLRRGQGLVLRQGELQTARAACQAPFAAFVARAFARSERAGGAEALRLPHGEQGHLSVHALPLVGGLGRTLLERPTLLLLAGEEPGPQDVAREAISQRYGCTRSEARLAQLVCSGQGLRQAAQTMGIGYGTARTYLKIVFEKTSVRSQAQLVARLLGDPALRPAQGTDLTAFADVQR